MIVAGVSGDEEEIIAMTKLCAADLISKGISLYMEQKVHLFQEQPLVTRNSKLSASLGGL